MSEASTWAEIGLGLNGEFRDFLSSMRLRYPTLRWHEGSGFITRRYDIVGPHEAITRLNATFREYERRTAAIRRGSV